MLILSLIILSLLLSATLFVYLQIRNHPTPELLNNRKRIHTWWLISLICVPVFYIGDWALTILIFVLVYWAAFEFLRMQNMRFSLVQVFFITGIILVYHVMLNRFADAAYLFFIIPGVILLLFFMFFHARRTRRVVLLLFCVTSIESILLISNTSERSGYDSGLIILFLFFITSLNDIAQYICGAMFGKNRLAPYISPNKTIEGAVGGIFLTGLLVAITLPTIVNITWPMAILSGMFISILGIIGDLSFSFVKRQARIKDTGSSMPGHGGLLDRIDSLTLTAPGFGLCLSLLS